MAAITSASAPSTAGRGPSMSGSLCQHKNQRDNHAAANQHSHREAASQLTEQEHTTADMLAASQYLALNIPFAFFVQQLLFSCSCSAFQLLFS